MQKICGSFIKAEGKSYLYLPKVVGNFSVYINGILAERLIIPSVYWHPMPYALNAEEFAEEGLNEFVIVSDSFKERADISYEIGHELYPGGFYANAEYCTGK